MKRVAMNLAESKRVDKTYPIGGVTTFAHDSLYECLLHTTLQTDTAVMTSIVVGGGPSSRVGDEVYSIGFRIKGCFGLPFDRRNVQIKLWLVEYNSNQGTPTTQAQWYRVTTGNNMIDPIDNDRFPGVKLLRVLRAKPKDLYVERGDITDTGSINQIYYNIWIPFKRKLRYTSTSTVPPISGTKERLSLIMTAYDTPSTITTDTVVLDHRQSVTWYYKDP